MNWIKTALVFVASLALTMALPGYANEKNVVAEKSLSARLWQATDARNANDDSFAQALSTGSDDDKRIAALGLGRIGGDDVVARLSSVLNAKDQVQRYALFGLGISLSEQATAPLQQTWRSGAVATNNRDVALMAIANRGDDGAQQLLLEVLRDAVKQRDTKLARSAAQALGQLWSYRRDKLSALAKDTAPLLLQLIEQRGAAATMAAFALSRARREPDFYTLDTLASLLQREKNPRTALFLARAYGAPAAAAAAEKLFDLAQQDGNALVRYEATFALARSADEVNAWRHTQALVQHKDAMTAIAAIQGLSERPALIEQHRGDVEKWRENRALTYSVQRALPSENAAEESTEPAQKTFAYDEIKSALGVRYRIATERGDITIRLSDETPYTSYNFAQLADSHYYDGRVFFRVVPGFVAQTGDPTDTGEGGPGFSIREELSLNPQDEHWLGIATAGKDTGGSQFFLNAGHNPHLDWHYTTFAKIEKGVDVIAKIVPGDKIISIKRR